MIDIHAPDLLATLNHRARHDRAALNRDLKELVENRPADFVWLVGEVLAPAAYKAIGHPMPAAEPRRATRKGKRAP